MIIVEISKTGRLKIKNQNSNPFNHAYNRPQEAEEAWDSFVEQIKAGKVKKVGFPKKRKTKKVK